MSENGKYGEPWEATGHGDICDINGGYVVADGGMDGGICEYSCPGATDRIVACVNALAGLANPAAVGELIAAVERLKRNARHMNSIGTEWRVTGDDLAAIEAALAACKGGE